MDWVTPTRVQAARKVLAVNSAGSTGGCNTWWVEGV